MIVNKKFVEIFGVMIVELGWGFMIFCVIIVYLVKDGLVVKFGRFNVGD